GRDGHGLRPAGGCDFARGAYKIMFGEQGALHGHQSRQGTIDLYISVERKQGSYPKRLSGRVGAIGNLPSSADAREFSTLIRGKFRRSETQLRGLEQIIAELKRYGSHN